jgi:hypothetical protein
MVDQDNDGLPQSGVIFFNEWINILGWWNALRSR